MRVNTLIKLLLDANSMILFSCTEEAFDRNHTSSSYDNVCEEVLSEQWCPTCKCTNIQSKCRTLMTSVLKVEGETLSIVFFFSVYMLQSQAPKPRCIVCDNKVTF